MIAHIIQPKKKDLGGFQVRRLLPAAAQRMVGPWIFFDHMGPAEFEAGAGINVRPHPHINLATVTYLFQGEILHRDSLGSVQTIQPGAINLMVAGSGIVHSERESPEVRNRPHRAHGLQLWHALPESDEETEPAFYHYPASQIPSIDVGEVPVRVLMGSAYGVTSPVKTFSDTLYVEAPLQMGNRLLTPAAPELAIYLVSGSMRVADVEAEPRTMLILEPGAQVEMEALSDARIAMVGGSPLGERFIDWNFVSSRRERIAAAREDWQQRRFALVPGDEEEFIPLPD